MSLPGLSYITAFMFQLFPSYFSVFYIFLCFWEDQFLAFMTIYIFLIFDWITVCFLSHTKIQFLCMGGIYSTRYILYSPSPRTGPIVVGLVYWPVEKQVWPSSFVSALCASSCSFCFLSHYDATWAPHQTQLPSFGLPCSRTMSQMKYFPFINCLLSHLLL